MAHYILIDQNTGYVWGEAHAASPIEACRAVDASIGTDAREYTEHGPRSGATRDQTGGYFVYEAPAGFDINAVGDGDGRSDELVDAVSAMRCAAFIKTRDTDHFA